MVCLLRRFVRIGRERRNQKDAFSLLICQGLVQPEGRKIEISRGPDGKSYEMHTSSNGLIVSPWPFEVNSFELRWESRTVPQLSFNNPDEFRKAAIKTTVVSHQIKLVK